MEGNVNEEVRRDKPEATVQPTDADMEEVAQEEEQVPPLTMKESVEGVKEIGRAARTGAVTAKHNFLQPAYRFGRRTLRSAALATEAFFEGALGGKKK